MMRAKAVSRAVDRAQAMRDNALSVAMKRKEEFLGARVPKELRDKVTARAHEQGIPVSILIRNILEEAFKNPPGSGYSARGDELPQGQGAPPVPPAAAALTHPCVTRFPAVLGWDVIRLNRPVDCASCGKRLLPGASVTLGLVSGLVQAGETHIILCDQCQGLM